MNWSQFHEDYMKPQNVKTMKTPKKETVIYVELPKADRVYINNIGCLRYELGPLSGPVMSTIDTYLGDYEVSEYKDGRIVLVLKTITPKKEENSAHSFTEGSEEYKTWIKYYADEHKKVSKPSVTEESQEELWKSFHDDYIKLEHAHQWVDLKNKFTITRKPKTT